MKIQSEINERNLHSILRWGSTYFTGLSLADTAEVIVEEAQAQGLKITSIWRETDRWMIEATQTARWYHVVAKALPQRVRWVLQWKGNKTVVTSDNQFFAWFVVLIVGSCMATWCLFDLGFHYLFALAALAHPSNQIWGVSLLLIASFLLFLNFYWVNAGSGGRMRRWMHALETRIESRGSFVDREKVGASRRTSCRMMILLTFPIAILAVAAWKILGTTGQDISFILGAVITWVLILAAVLTVVLLYSYWGHRGFIWRTLPLLPGLCTAMALVFLVAPLAMWMIISSHGSEVSNVTQQLESYLHNEPPNILHPDKSRTNFQEAKPEVGEEGLVWFKTYARLFVIVSFIIAGMGFAVLALSVYTALSFWPWILRLQKKAQLDYVRTATTAQGFLSFFRWIFAGFWFAASVFFVTGVLILAASILLNFLNVRMSDIPSVAVIHVTDASSHIMAVAFGMKESTVRPIVLAGWILYAILCVSPHIVSCVLWFRSRGMVLETLKTNAKYSLPSQEKIQETLQKLADRARIKCPTLSISPDFVVYSRSISFGLLRKKNFCGYVFVLSVRV